MKKVLIYTFSTLFLIIVICLVLFKKDYQVVYAEFNEKIVQGYAPDGYIKFDNKSYLTTNRWIYKWNFLTKRIVPHGESILVYKFDFFDNHYSKIEDGFRFLFLKEEKDHIEYNGQSYKVNHKKGDSLFSKINKNEIIIFINSENLD